jgi:hypothetical protein
MGDTTGHTATGPTGEYWVNLATGEVERGRQSPGLNRMGPYPTRAAAEHAFETAAARNEAWDEADRRWSDDDWSRDA